MNETPNVGRPPIVIALRVSGTCSAEIAARYNKPGLTLTPTDFVGFDPFLFGGDPNTGRQPAGPRAAAIYWRDRTLLPAILSAFGAFAPDSIRPQFLIHAIRHAGDGPYRWDSQRVESSAAWTEWWEELEGQTPHRIPWGCIHVYKGSRQTITESDTEALSLSEVDEALQATLSPGGTRRALSGVAIDSAGSVAADDPILAIVEAECNTTSTRLGIEGGNPLEHPATRVWWFESRRFRPPFGDASEILPRCWERGQMAVGLCWYDGRPQIAQDIDRCVQERAVPCLSWNDVLEWKRATGLQTTTIIQAAAAGNLVQTLSAAGSVN